MRKVPELLSRRLVALLLVIVACLGSASTHAGSTLDNVRKRGELRCGVADGIPGFSQQDKDGRWHGIEADFCRALAAAVLGDSGCVQQLLASGADANVRDSEGGTVLMQAAHAGSRPIVEILLKAGAEANAADERGWTALMNVSPTRTSVLARTAPSFHAASV